MSEQAPTSKTDTEQALLDYQFDLQGYLHLENAIAREDLDEMNQWVDDHWSYVDDYSGSGHSNQWIGHVETHSYQEHDGVNFQNICEGGAVFEKLIDHPAWIELVRRYVNSQTNGLSIHENFLTVRGQDGYISIHCGGHTPLCYLTFRQHNTGDWMVGQINVLIALTDIGPGDGPTVLVPGSHKCTETHPRLAAAGKKTISLHGESAGSAVGMKEMYLNAGDVLMFTDAITHGSTARTNPGFRRSIVYRYSPTFIRTRFNYEISEGLLERLTEDQRQIIRPLPLRQPTNGDA